MQDWKQSSNIIILYYRRYSCGKFLSNILSFNQLCFPPVANTLLDTLFAENNTLDLEKQLTKLKIEEIFNTLPLTEKDCKQWSQYELSDNEFWNFFNGSFGMENDPVGNFLNRVSTAVVKLLSSNKRCFITCHDTESYKDLVRVFPNATTIALINDHLPNKYSLQLKTNNDISPQELPLINGSLNFDIGSMFDKEQFFQNVSVLLSQLNIDNTELDTRVYDYYNRYINLYNGVFMNQEQRETIERIKQHAERKIWVTFRKEGIHCYPAAATDPALATGDEYDVSFLGTPHRHIFHFRVWIDVVHNDRDIEFIQFKRWLENLYKEGTIKLDYRSCEMMSDDLYLQIADRYPGRAVWIEVAEDGENGALIKYETHRPYQSITI